MPTLTTKDMNPDFEALDLTRTTRPPARLFKYCNVDSALAILKTGALYFTAPRLFNDNLDSQWNPGDFTLTSPYKVQSRAELSRRLARGFDLSTTAPSPIRDGLMHDQRMLDALPDDERAKRLEELLDTTEQVFEREYREAWTERSTVIDNLRILCLCERPDSDAMWMDYADNHRGCVLEFDSRALELGWRNHPQPVSYGDTLPSEVIPPDFMSRVLGDLPKYTEQEDRKRLYGWLCFKLTKWRDEHEWRFIVLDDAGSPQRIPHRFPPNALIGVHCGARCESDDVRRIQRVAKP